MLRSWSLQNTSTRTFRSLLHGFNNHEKYTVIPEYHGLSSPLRSTSPSSIDRLGGRNFRISVDTVKVYQQHQHHYSSRLPLFSTWNRYRQLLQPLLSVSCPVVTSSHGVGGGGGETKGSGGKGGKRREDKEVEELYYRG